MIADRVAAETWFLERGLPMVLTPRARWRRLWHRSTPVLAGCAALVVCVAMVTTAAGNEPIDIDGDPTAREWLILAVLVLAVPVAIGVGWLAGVRVRQARRRTASNAAIGVMVATALVTSPASDRFATLAMVAVLVATVLLLNGLGVGSVLAWAIRLTASRLASAGRLVTRALPVVLLSVLVFFNAYVWSMATTISRGRMWSVIAFMMLIAIAFLVTGIVERVRPMLATSAAERDTDSERLSDTPFRSMPTPTTSRPLSRGERANVMFVVAASQIVQIAVVAAVTAAIFLTLGLLMLSPELLATWTRNGTEQGTWLGMTLPVPQSLLHVSMFLGALTFMYVSARAVGDGEYRTEFLDPLVDDLRLTVVARNRYRTHVSG